MTEIRATYDVGTSAPVVERAGSIARGIYLPIGPAMWDALRAAGERCSTDPKQLAMLMIERALQRDQDVQP